MPLEADAEHASLQAGRPSLLLSTARAGLDSPGAPSQLPADLPRRAQGGPAAQVTYMQDVKAAFLAEDALAVVAALVAEPLGKLPRALPRQEELLLQLVITFLRNLLAVPDRATTAGAAWATAAV